MARGVSEFWQADRLLNEDDLDLLQPMWADFQRAPHRHFYVKELAQTEGGEFIVPLMWLKEDGEVWADGHAVRQEEVRVGQWDETCHVTR